MVALTAEGGGDVGAKKMARKSVGERAACATIRYASPDMQIPAGASRQGSAEKSTDGEQSPGGPSRTCAMIKIHCVNPRKTIL
jgi:hypothetical protein